MILLVEDDVLIRSALAEHLRDSGHSVLEAANANEAIAVLQSAHRITLVIADFVLPDMDGLEFIDHLRELLRDIPLILISGYLPQEAGEVVLAKFSAGSTFLPKPVRPTVLELTVQSLLRCVN